MQLQLYIIDLTQRGCHTLRFKKNLTLYFSLLLYPLFQEFINTDVVVVLIYLKV